MEGSKKEICTWCWNKSEQLEIRTALCGHLFCTECAGVIFSLATNDRSFPVRCCNMSLDQPHIREFLAPEILSMYDIKKKELEVQIPMGVYCSTKNCSVLLQPGNEDKSSKLCPNCGAITCMLCKGRGHFGSCPVDIEQKQFLELVAKKGWRACPECGQMVGKDGGCQELICHCGTPFCYGCGKEIHDCCCGARYVEENRNRELLEEGPGDVRTYGFDLTYLIDEDASDQSLRRTASNTPSPPRSPPSITAPSPQLREDRDLQEDQDPQED